MPQFGLSLYLLVFVAISWGCSLLINPVLCRMTRTALWWSQSDLASEAAVAIGVIRDYERGRSVPRRNNLSAITKAFQSEGVSFEMDVNGRTCAYFVPNHINSPGQKVIVRMAILVSICTLRTPDIT